MFKTLIFSLWLFFHPVHVSVTSIEYVQEKKLFSVFMRMNFDDFLIDYKLSGGDTSKTAFSVIDKKTIVEMEKFLKTRFSVVSDNIELKKRVLDIQIQENDLNMRFELPFKGEPGNIVVKNKVMTELYSDQTNMIILKVNDFEEGIKLNSEITEHLFSIK